MLSFDCYRELRNGKKYRTQAKHCVKTAKTTDPVIQRKILRKKFLKFVF